VAARQPGILPTIEVAFLNGQEMPTVQTAGPDFQFNVLGISTRAFFDIGVNEAELPRRREERRLVTEAPRRRPV
jgi:hypothetical protein